MPSRRVIGSGTVLDTARLKYLLAEHLEVDSRSIHAFIVGEHGDSEFAVWSSANVSGVPLLDFCDMRGHFNHQQAMFEIENTVRNSAYEIIKRKQATYYGIAMAVGRICEAVIRDEKSVLSVSSLIHNFYGVEDVTLSIPAVVGMEGIETLVPIRLNESEQEKLRNSANVLKDIIREVF